MTDDPCDPFPDTLVSYMHWKVLLDRETDPEVRQHIKTLINELYGRKGKSMMPRAMQHLEGLINDPCDPWPVWIKWTPRLDPRHRPTHNNMMGKPTIMFDDVEPPRNLGWFDCSGRYRIRQP